MLRKVMWVSHFTRELSRVMQVNKILYTNGLNTVRIVELFI